MFPSPSAQRRASVVAFPRLPGWPRRPGGRGRWPFARYGSRGRDGGFPVRAGSGRQSWAAGGRARRAPAQRGRRRQDAPLGGRPVLGAVHPPPPPAVVLGTAAAHPRRAAPARSRGSSPPRSASARLVLIRAGMVFEDFEDSAAAFAAACGARDCRVTASPRWSWLLFIDIIRRDVLGPARVVRSPLADLPALDRRRSGLARNWPG